MKVNKSVSSSFYLNLAIAYTTATVSPGKAQCNIDYETAKN